MQIIPLKLFLAELGKASDNIDDEKLAKVTKSTLQNIVKGMRASATTPVTPKSTEYNVRVTKKNYPSLLTNLL